MQNTPSDFINIPSKFMTRLSERGHTPETLEPLLLQAAAGIDTAPSNSGTNTSSNTLYLHWSYNPYGIQSNTIRHLYNKILHSHIPFDRMQIALSRPENLRDILTHTQITVPENVNLPELISNLSHTKQNHEPNMHKATIDR